MSRPVGPIPGLLHRQSVNLLVGSPSSGKTLLALSQLEEYAAGKGFLGYPAEGDYTPVQLGVISATRTLNDMLHSVQPFPLLSSQSVFPIEAWNSGDTEISELDTLNRIYSKLSETTPQNRPVRLLLIEGIQSLMQTGKVNDNKQVKDFCIRLHKFCETRDVTILGTVGTAKMKKGDYYPLLADRVFGAATWAHESKTFLGIEQIDLHRPISLRPSVRRVIIQVPDGPARVLHVDFDDDGRLKVLTEAVIDEQTATNEALDDRLAQEKDGAVFRRRELDEWGEQLPVPVGAKTVERWIMGRVGEGFLEKRGHTRSVTYHKPFPQ